MPHLVTPHSRCHFGLTRGDVTPPVGIYHRMWGAATHDRATGVHRPLTATAMIFRSATQPAGPETELAVIAIDHVLFWGREMDGLLQRVGMRTALPSGSILLAFSHTHAAGLMGLERQTLPGGELIAPYLENLGDRLGDLLEEARQSAQPVTITYGTGRCSLAGHRDFWDETTQQWVCGFNPQGPADDTVLVARVTDEAGKVLATAVNYACHPTTLAFANTHLSPDYPGAMREVIERATGAPCVFLQGASGDLGPVDGYVGDPAVADRNGRQLGYAALSALEALPPPGTRFEYTGPVLSGATLGTWAHRPLGAAEWERKADWRLEGFQVQLPYREGLPVVESLKADRARWQAAERAAHETDDAARARDCRAMVERMDRQLLRLENLPPGQQFPLPVTLWRIGDALWLAVEGEHYQYLQRTLRSRFPAVPIIVITLANGSRCTYLPTADTYGKGIYQESIALLAPGSLESLTETLAARIHTLLTEG